MLANRARGSGAGNHGIETVAQCNLALIAVCNGAAVCYREPGKTHFHIPISFAVLSLIYTPAFVMRKPLFAGLPFTRLYFSQPICPPHGSLVRSSDLSAS